MDSILEKMNFYLSMDLKYISNNNHTNANFVIKVFINKVIKLNIKINTVKKKKI